MANYATGISTKNRILRYSKMLFYSKGYLETSYSEICTKAKVNPGSIAYHFKGGKSGIAKYIYTEMLQSYQKQVEELLPSEDPLIQMIMSLCIHQKRLFDDNAYRRFSSQFSSECVNEISIEEYEASIPMVYKYISEEMDELRASFYFAAIAGMDSRIEPFIDDNIDKLTYEKSVQYSCELYLWYLNITKREKLIDYALKMMQRISINNNGLDAIIVFQ